MTDDFEASKSAAEIQEILRDEAKKWNKIVVQSKRYQKRIKQPSVNLNEHPFCEGKRLREIRNEMKWNQNPQLFKTQNTEWYKKSVAAQQKVEEVIPTRGPTQGILRQSFGHRPRSASRHFDALSMSVRRHPRNGKSEIPILPRAGALSSSQLFQLLGSAMQHKNNERQTVETNHELTRNQKLSRNRSKNVIRKLQVTQDEVVLEREPVLLDEQKSRINDPEMLNREISWNNRHQVEHPSTHRVGPQVNAVLTSITSMDMDRRQKLKHLARVSAGRSEFHPFCFDRQLEDEWRLVNLHEEQLHGRDSSSRRFLTGSIIHSTSPREPSMSDTEVQRMFEQYRARKLMTGQM